MDPRTIRSELLAADLAQVGESRLLRVGLDHLRLVGVEPSLTALLAERFGPFLEPDRPEVPAFRLELVGSTRRQWLRQEGHAERYRLEAEGAPEQRLVVSYHFALARLPGAVPAWRAALAADPPEPAGRIVENVARCLAAQAALDRGGIALHGAGVVRDGRAHVFAGPSNSGKTTAVRLSRPAVSLGDDFAVVVPVDGDWVVPAVPFDNAERIEQEPPAEPLPLAGVWRLDKAPHHRLERLERLAAVASLMGCVTFPWLFPEAGGALLERVTRLVENNRFGVLHFRPDPDFWSVLL